MSDRHNKMKMYLTGSFLVFLVCTVLVASLFTFQYLAAERARAAVFSRQIQHFFEFENQVMAEEMWTGNTEAVLTRVNRIAIQLGSDIKAARLMDRFGRCLGRWDPVTSSVVNCAKESDNKQIVDTGTPVLSYDAEAHIFNYVSPLHANGSWQGVLRVQLTDPFRFNLSNGYHFFLDTYWEKILVVLGLWFLWHLLSRRYLLRPYLASIVAAERRDASANMAKRFAHDIRSPLETLLFLVRHAMGLQDSQRHQLRAAAARIQSLADELLSRHRPDRHRASAYTFVFEVVEAIIAEKIVLLEGRRPIEVTSSAADDAQSLVVGVSQSDLSRVLSNILNNAIEAITNRGEVQVHLQTSQMAGIAMAKISITDNGIGMDEVLLEKQRTTGGSFGKVNGAGIGLVHAREVMTQAGGKLNIISALGKGTTIELFIPLFETPPWMPSELVVGKRHVIILDDDESTHMAWSRRLAGFSCTHLYDPQDFRQHVNVAEDNFYIIDQEFTNSLITGLDLIKLHGISHQAVLVTSYFNDPDVQRRVMDLNGKMLPKFMIPNVAISYASSTIEASEKVDLVLLDDDLLIHDLWSLEAEMRGLSILFFTDEMQVAKLDLPASTPIFVDKNLANGVCGMDVAKTLYDRGYQSIYLATGEAESVESVPGFLRGVVGKSFPHSYL